MGPLPRATGALKYHEYSLGYLVFMAATLEPTAFTTELFLRIKL
jgi:hypothetical protein